MTEDEKYIFTDTMETVMPSHQLLAVEN